MNLLAAIDFKSTLTWAVFIAWIMSVVLHELAHGIVGYLGGDYTIRERGGLTLNPLQYIDPVFSLLIPAIILIVGGVPLPGGVTYIRMDLIKSRAWQSAVSLAGPAMNFFIFLGCCLPFHPKLHWIETESVNGQWPNYVLFLGAFGLLQLLTCFFNLAPIPSLDGFGILSPYLNDRSKAALTPQLRQTLFFIWFIMLWQVPAIFELFYRLMFMTLKALGFDFESIHFLTRAYNFALFGKAM